MSALYSTAGLIHASLKGFSTCLKTNEGAQVSAALDFSAAYNLIRCVMKEEMLQIADQSYCVRGIYYPKSKMVFDICKKRLFSLEGDDCCLTTCLTGSIL